MNHTKVRVFVKNFMFSFLFLLILFPVDAHTSDIQIPQSGQTNIYATSDDGDIRAGMPWPSPRFSDNSNNTVTDNLTGLIWASDANIIKNSDPDFDKDGTAGDGAVTWQRALEYIKRLNREKFLGYKDWRLPNLNELSSLVNQGRADSYAWLSEQGIYDVQAYPYWSSSSCAFNMSMAWITDIDSGHMQSLKKTGYSYVWPVRGGATASSRIALPKTGQNACYDLQGYAISCAGSGQDGELQTGVDWPNPRFSDNGDQTVSDNLTGLIWAKDANLMIVRDPNFDVAATFSDGAVTWQDALDYVRKLNQEAYLSFSDWRLPNRNELFSVMNYAETDTSSWLIAQGILNVRKHYWSSGTHAFNFYNAWNVNMDGIILDKNKSVDNISIYYGSFVWPVRGGQIANAPFADTLASPSTVEENGSNAVSSQTFAATAIALSVTTVSLPYGTVGAAYTQALVATGGTTPYTWSRTSGSLPAGLTLSTAGVISGTPTTAANSSFTVQVKDKTRTIATKALSIVVNAAPLTITTSALPNGYLGTAYNQTLAATGGKTSYTWSIITGSLPTGLSISTTGVISGTPTTTATSTFTVQVKDAAAITATRSFSIVVNVAPLSITTTSLPAGTTGRAYSQTLAATGGKAPYTWSITTGSLPAGLTISTDGVIGGTPTTTTTSSFTVQVKAADATTATRSLSITTILPTLTIYSTLHNGYVNVSYYQGLEAIDGTYPYTWSIKSGSLPAGLTFSTIDNSSLITGTPTAVGSSTFTVLVKDAKNKTSSKTFTINISVNLTNITTSTLADGNDTVPYSQDLAVTGGISPYRWSQLSGSFPDGLFLDRSTGIISGTPRGTGTSTFTIQAFDANDGPSTKTFTIIIKNAPLTITSSTLATGHITAPYIYHQALAATGGLPPYKEWTIASGNLPYGLTLDPSTGYISGLPTTDGNYTFTVQVKDSNNAVTSKLLNISVKATSLISSISPLPNAVGVTATNVNATFNEALDPKTITSGSFTVVRKSKVIKVATGGGHTVALRDDGTVTAWGENSDGQISIPVGLTNVMSVAAGGSTTVALKEDGTVVAWGSNYDGQTSVPTGLSEVVAIAAGGRHTVALKSDGKVVAWGNNEHGQTTVPTDLSGVVAVAVGSTHTVALKGDGTVVAWGSNVFNQSAVPSNLSGVVAVAAGSCHTVAMKDDGTLVAWGDNSNGQTVVPSNLFDVVAVAAGSNHTLALRNDGTVVAWGESYSLSSVTGQAFIPNDLTGVVSISAGGLHDVVVKNDGTVVAWALKRPSGSQDGIVSGWFYNEYNQATVPAIFNGAMAVAATGYSNTMVLKADGTVAVWGTSTSIPADLTGVVSISSAGNNLVALKDDGTVFSWDGYHVQNTAPDGLVNVAAVAAGAAHIIALQRDGTVVAWGDGDFGKTTVPDGLSGVISVAAGGDGQPKFWIGTIGHSVAVKGDGTVVAWGDNSYGQTIIPNNLAGVVMVAAGWNHTVALKSDGTVVAWGDNIYGQSTVPAELSGVIAAAAGGNHTVALKSDGTVVAWGNNDTGQTNVPSGLSGVVAVAAGRYHSLALKADGTVVGWGSNSYGQTTTPSSPYETILPGIVTWNPATLTATFVPDTPLPAESTIKVSLSQGVKSQSGNRLPSNASWSFTTVPAVLSIETQTLPDGYTGTVYSKTLVAKYGKPPYAWSVTGGSLPPGLMFNTSTGVLSGTPTGSGSFTLTVQVNDSTAHSASKTFSISVYAPVAIATTTLRNGYVGAPYALTLVGNGGKTPYTWAITSGALPAGLSLNTGTGQITGTPVSTGAASVTIQVKDSNNVADTMAFNQSIMQPVPQPISVSPTSVDFYSVVKGAAATTILTITNISGSSLAIGTITPPATPYSVVADSCTSQTLLPSAQCQVSVRFAPLLGKTYNDQLNIAFNDINYTDVAVPVSGQGINTYFMPDTGGGESQRNPISYTLTSSAITTDDNTGLKWQRKPSIAPMTWSAADNYCKGQNIDGLDGWRLPNYIEMTSIVNYGAYNPAIDTSAFSNTTGAAYWTSNTVTYPQVAARTVNFLAGEMSLTDKTATALVRCVNGDSLAASLVSSPDSLTLYDESSGLSWMSSWMETSGIGWSTMPALCNGAASARYGGYRDWRMPTIKELTTFDDIDSWSSTAWSGNPTTYALVFSSGGITPALKSDTDGNHVLKCVRGGSVASVFTVGDSGNVSIMKTSINFDARKADGTYNDQPRKVVATEYFKTHEDVDFLVFLSTFDYTMPEAGAQGFYLPVKNDTQGINQPLTNNTAQFGSAGKLQGTIDLGNVTALAGNPYGPNLEETITTLNHELMHRFGAYVRFKNQDGSLNDALLGKDDAHWSYLLDTKGSLMYGNGWKDNKDGTFTATSAKSGFSPLDLYLMGMIPKEQVPPMLLIDNPTIDKTKLPNLGDTITGTVKTVTIDDIISAEGQRIPDVSTAQKQFNVGFVLLTRPGDNTVGATSAIETLRKAWAGRFAELTQGKGIVGNVTSNMELIVDSPVENTTITGPDVTVNGTVINTSGAETGVTVNGMLATVTGNRFLANHVPLQTGTNTITVTATDVNGVTATSTKSITSSPGNYLRITTNIESGSAPMNISLRLNGSFNIVNPSINLTGPAPIMLTPGENQTEFTSNLTIEGTYLITASAVGPDAQTYSDSVSITVVSRYLMETLLKGKWEGMKSAIIGGNIESALTNFVPAIQDKFRGIFTDPARNITARLSEIRRIEIASVDGVAAQAVAIRLESVGERAYPLNFVRDEDGIWKILGF